LHYDESQCSGLSPAIASLQADPHFCVATLLSLIRFDNGHKGVKNVIDYRIGSSNMNNTVLNV